MHWCQWIFFNKRFISIEENGFKNVLNKKNGNLLFKNVY